MTSLEMTSINSRSNVGYSDITPTLLSFITTSQSFWRKHHLKKPVWIHALPTYKYTYILQTSSIISAALYSSWSCLHINSELSTLNGNADLPFDLRNKSFTIKCWKKVSLSTTSVTLFTGLFAKLTTLSIAAKTYKVRWQVDRSSKLNHKRLHDFPVTIPTCYRDVYRVQQINLINVQQRKVNVIGHCTL